MPGADSPRGRLPGMVEAPLYVHSGGCAQTPTGNGWLSDDIPGDEPPDLFAYDASDPAMSLVDADAQMRPVDQCANERRSDVLVYATEPLTTALALAGPRCCELRAASDAPDTDFCVKLVEVRPDGVAINVSNGFVRARYRNGHGRKDLLVPGEPYLLLIEMLPVGIRLEPDSHLRLDIASSGFPAFDRNHNTCGQFGRKPNCGSRDRPCSTTRDARRGASCPSSGETVHRRDGKAPIRGNVTIMVASLAASTEDPAAEEQPESRYVVEALVRALSVLDMVAEKGYDVSLAEIVKDLDLPKATAYRYLRTLVASGYLEQREGHRSYSVGPRFLAVARTAEALDRLRRAAHPEIVRLADHFGRTANLGILADGGVAYIDMVETRRYPDVKARVGGRDALHATALGKAILAHLPEDEQDARLDTPLSEQTIKTITDRARLRRELEAVRAHGYALDREENEDGAMCVGVPILCGSAYPVAAMSLTMLTRSRAIVPLKEVISELLKAASNVSITLDRPTLVSKFTWRHRPARDGEPADLAARGEPANG